MNKKFKQIIISMAAFMAAFGAGAWEKMTEADRDKSARIVKQESYVKTEKIAETITDSKGIQINGRANGRGTFPNDNEATVNRAIYARIQSGHIWACPPSEGDDYIFHCHPPDQKIPKPKRLQEWYKKMLDKAVSERIVHDYKVRTGMAAPLLD